jgi:hypothetical protein
MANLIKIHNVQTGEIIEREMTDDELAQWEIDQVEHASRLGAETTKAAEKAALLAKLGITADEAKLLLS